MNDTLEYVNAFARFPFALRRFLTNRLTLEDARRIVRDRMANRDDHFLRVVETRIYGYPRSPYLPLLKMAGCELGNRGKTPGNQAMARSLMRSGSVGTRVAPPTLSRCPR